jgi:hypothetical protein
MEIVHTHVESETRDVSNVYTRFHHRVARPGFFQPWRAREFYHSYVMRQVFTRTVETLTNGEVLCSDWSPAGDEFEVDLGFSHGIAS